MYNNNLKICSCITLLIFLFSSCISEKQFPKTTPKELDVSSRIIPKGNGKILILSPVSFEQVSENLTLENIDPKSTAGITKSGISQTTDFNIASSIFERELLNHGWSPYSQATIAKAAFETNLSDKINATKGNKFTLLQAAMILAENLKPDAILIIRSINLFYETTPIDLVIENGDFAFRRWKKHPPAVFPLVCNIDAALYSNTGETYWSGNVFVRASDFWNFTVNAKTFFTPGLILISTGILSYFVGVLSPDEKIYERISFNRDSLVGYEQSNLKIIASICSPALILPGIVLLFINPKIIDIKPHNLFCYTKKILDPYRSLIIAQYTDVRECDINSIQMTEEVQSMIKEATKKLVETIKVEK